MNLILTYKALREYRRNLRWIGMWHLIKRNWRALLFHPWDEYQKALGLSAGGFT